MIANADLRRLVNAHGRVALAMEKNKPREAAKILCEEFRWLGQEKGSFWEQVHAGTGRLSDFQREENEVLGNLALLIEQEEAIFAKLGIPVSRSGPIIGNVYGALKWSQANNEGPSPESLAHLRTQLHAAEELICRESKSGIRRGVNWVLSYRGATILGGAAVMGANIAVFVHLPHHGKYCWASAKAGYKVMQGDLTGIIDLFGGQSGA